MLAASFKGFGGFKAEKMERATATASSSEVDVISEQEFVTGNRLGLNSQVKARERKEAKAAKESLRTGAKLARPSSARSVGLL